MSRHRPADDLLERHKPAIARLSSWMASLNGDVPSRVLSSVRSGRDMVLLTATGSVAPELRDAILRRLHVAGLSTIAQAAPLGSPDTLQQILARALLHGRDPANPVLLMVGGAERLSAASLHQLQALAALRRDGRPVLTVVLSANATIQTLLLNAGLETLWNDAGAHIRLVPDLAACLPAASASPVQPEEPPGFATRPTRRRLRLACLAVLPLAAGLALILVPRHATPPAVPLPAAAARFVDVHPAPAQPEPPGVPPASVAIASAVPSLAATAPAPKTPAPETRVSETRVSETPAPATPATDPGSTIPPPMTAPAALRLSDSPLLVTVRYRLGEPAAEQAARDLLSRLRAQGRIALGPQAASPHAAAGVAFGLEQDRNGATKLALVLGLPVGKTTPGRPGAVSVTLGGNADVGAISKIGDAS